MRLSLLLGLLASVLVSCVCTSHLAELERLVKLKADGSITEGEYERFKAELINSSIEPAGHRSAVAGSGGEVGTILHELGLSELLPTFQAHGINTQEQLLLLDHTTLANYMEVGLGNRLKIVAYIEETKSQQEDASNSGEAIDKDEVGALLAGMIHAHQEKQAGRDRIAEVVAEMFEKNNRMMLEKVSAMISEAATLGGGGLGGGPRPQQHRRQQRRELTAEARTLNTDGATMWLEDDDGKLVIGAAADTDLSRAREKVLSTSGALRVGDTADDACSSAEDAGTIRWAAAAEEGLQVCDEEGEWTEAGGSVSDGGSVTTFEDHCSPCASGVDGPNGVQDQEFTSTTKEGYTLTMSGWSHLRDYAGFGFLCNESGSCNDKMKVEIEGLTANARFWWKVWGFDSRDDARDNPQSYASTFSISANGAASANGDFMHCVDLEHCTPAAHAVTAADGDGKIVLTWTRTSAVGLQHHVYLSAVSIVNVDPVATIPQYLGVLTVASLASAGPVIVGAGSACGVAQEGALRWESADKRLEICNGEEYKAVYEPPPEVQGGADSTYGMYKVNTFDQPGSHTLTVVGGGVTCDILLVAGGGGGGGANHGHVAGGGGAGGVVQVSDATVPAGSYTVEVGHAGNKGHQGDRGENGHDSSITLSGLATAVGGGGGGRAENQPPGTSENGGTGGSGGGAGSCDQQATNPGGDGTPQQGNHGGTSGSRGSGKGGTGGGCASGGSSANTGGSKAAGGACCGNSWQTGTAQCYGQGGGTAGNTSNESSKGRGGNGGYNGDGKNGNAGIVILRCIL